MSTPLDRLYAGVTRLAVVQANGSFSGELPIGRFVALAGSFNPLHRGHRNLLSAAEKISGRIGIYEISVENVDKPDLPREELERRLKQFSGKTDVAITRAKLFSEKAEILPGTWFVIGYDTAVRLLDARYYSSGTVESHMRRFEEAGLKFLVAGRADNRGRFRGLKDLSLHESLSEMFIEIPESDFREDVSSTELRERRSE